MATEQPLLMTSWITQSDLTSKQFCLLTETTTAGQVALAGAGNLVLGVAQDTPKAQQVVNLMQSGISKVLVGAAGAIAVGALLASDAAGKAITATTGQYVFGIAREAGVAGQIISVLLVSPAKA